MKKLAIALTLAVVGCGGGPKMDPTPNQMRPELKYPAGPYGYVKGSVIENIVFVGKRDPAGATGSADYASIPMERFSLADYHNDPATKYIALSGAAGWCAPCNAEQAYVIDWSVKYESKGVRFLEALVQGFNARTGAPATEADINRWASMHSLHVAIGLDPQGKMFQYADVSAFPVNMILRTSDMQIQLMEVGLDAQAFESALDALP